VEEASDVREAISEIVRGVREGAAARRCSRV